MSLHLLFAQTEPPPPAGRWAVARFLAEFWMVLVPVILGLAAVYLLLPRARRYPPLWGGLLGGLALVVAGWWLVHFEAASVEAVLFYTFAGLAVLSAGMMVVHSNPVYAALSFAMVVLSTCGLFLLLGAPFLTAATVIVYAGAIIVTFLFVIMLAQQLGYSGADQRSREPFLASLAGCVLLAAILCVLHRAYEDPDRLAAANRLQGLLGQARAAKDARTVADIRDAIGDGRTFFREFRDLVKTSRDLPAETQNVRDRVEVNLDAAEEAWNQRDDHWGRVEEKVADVTGHLQAAYDGGLILYTALATQSRLEPDRKLPASPYAVPPQQEGKPPEPGKVPAENVAGLGRALFTDYLLAFEVAGFLLLVATIGAIAVAARAKEGLR